ncbi:MAG TPA: methyltransferase domain-containing protein [Anaerolineae bacterium]|nr:methyltransferase domain-containing protein [Anaerolineae bacterium]HMR68524.1 methyltransferase domain-containing protein [Anaerolineae bacterium]
MKMLPRPLIKLGFYLLYHHLAWTYEAVAWSVSFGQWAKWRRLALRFIRPGPILELAYGTGELYIDMMEVGYRPLGIDLSPYMARLASRKLRQQGWPLALSRAQAQNLPFPSDYFANIIATFPTDYIFAPATLKEIQRVLRSPQEGQSAGRLIVVLEGQLQGPGPLRSFIEWLYKITDQHDFPPIKPLPRFAEHQLQVRMEWVEHHGVRARMLIAEKL